MEIIFFENCQLACVIMKNVLISLLFIGPLYVIVEYCALGNLLDFLRDSRPKPEPSASYEEPNSTKSTRKSLTTQDLVQFALQIARGMKFLAEKKVFLKIS